MESLITGALSCALGKAAEATSSELFFLDVTFIAYLLAYLFNRKACFIAAFFIVDVCSYFFMINTNGYVLFAVYSLMYSFVCWHGINFNWQVNTIRAYAIMVAFQIAAFLDAIVNPEIETVIYTYYEYIVVSIHFYIISTLIRWKLIRDYLERVINRVLCFFFGNYNFTLLLL